MTGGGKRGSGRGSRWRSGEIWHSSWSHGSHLDYEYAENRILLVENWVYREMERV